MPGGRPTKYKKKYHNAEFLKLSRQGKNFKQIAAKWDVMRSTLYKWAEEHPEFSDTMEKGRQLAETWWMELGHAAMLDQARVTEDGKKVKVKVNLGFFQFLTGNMFDWSKKIDKKIEHSGEVSNPSQAKTEDLKKRFEELKAKIKAE